jgi:pimeloyl-ACP methyl ester carboxylesterase
MAKIDGAKLYYEVRGEGHPLLLLHAGVADSRMWDDQFGTFTQHYTVVRYDLRGFGKSQVPPGQFAHHDDAARLLSTIGIEKAHVVGASFGGYVAVDLALAYPGMVASLVLSAPIISGYEPSSEELRNFFAEEEEALNRGDLVGATELNLRMWVDGPHRKPEQVNPDVRERVCEMQMCAFALPVPEDAERRTLTPPAITRLSEIQVPTLIISGDQDVPEFVEVSDLIAAGISGAKKVLIHGVAHLPSLEQPQSFNRTVLEFLEGQ